MKRNFVDKFTRDLNEFSKIINEAYIYDEEGEYAPEEHGGGYDEFEGDEMGGNDLSQHDDNIAKIREISLNGLQKYANDVDSEMYQFYKKIWLMCDKAVSEKDNVQSGKE